MKKTLQFILSFTTLILVLALCSSCSNDDEDNAGNVDNIDNIDNIDNVDNVDNVDEDVLAEMMAVAVPQPSSSIGSLDYSDADENTIASWNSFALSMLPNLYDGSDLVASPLSLQTVLAMLAVGSEGETQNEILSALGISSSADDLTNFCYKYITGLPAIDLNTTVSFANTLVIDDQYQIDSNYKSLIEESFFAPVVNMDFSDEELVLNTVNSWVASNTNDLITDILEEVGGIAYLINALYFKGEFYEPFYPESTTSRDFTSLAGNVVTVEMMRGSRIIPYSDWGNFTSISLPVGEKTVNYLTIPAFSLNIVLPDENVGLKDVIDEIAGGQEYLGQEDCKVNINLPKFNIESDGSLEDFVSAMGIETAFNSSADFSPMVGSQTFLINKIRQKACITVEEQGVEAAAATILEMDGDLGDEEIKEVNFIANRPFAFYLTEADTGLVLFVGVFTGV